MRAFSPTNPPARRSAGVAPSWQTVRTNAPYGDFIPSDGASLKFFGNVAYMFGGWRAAAESLWNNRKTTNEVWSTYDFGLTWTRVKAHDEAAVDRPSRRHTPGNCTATISGTEYWYIIGGDLEDAGYPTGHSDVWRASIVSSVLTWQKMAVHGTPGWADRHILSAGFLNGKLYVLGGATGPGAVGSKGDMWESSDAGATWSLTMGTTPFGTSLAAGEMVTLNNKMWLISGGYAGSCKNSVWSFDGSSWTEVLANGHSQFTQSFYNNQVAFGGKLWTVSGNASGGANLAETNSSANGVVWRSTTSPFTATHACALAAHTNGVLFATGNAMERATYWLSGLSSLPTGTNLVSSIIPDQLLLVESQPAHYTEAEWALHSHYLKDYSTGYRVGAAIPGYAPSNSLTGNETDRYAEVKFGSEGVGSYAGAIEIEFSLKTPATNTTRTGLVSHGNSSNWTYALTLEAGYQLGWRHDFTLLHTGTTVLTPSTWYRIKVVKTGSTGAWVVRFYINGVLDSTLNTADNAALWPSPVTYLLRVPNTWHCAGSITDLRFTYSNKDYRIPCCEGVDTALHWIETIGNTLGTGNGVLFSSAMWGTVTDHNSGAPNWILENGGNLDGFGSLVPAYRGVAANAGAVDLVPRKFSTGTIHCDPTGVGAGALGLESALTPTTERNTASSGKRRRRTQYGYTDRIAARSTAMSSTTENNYFND